MWKDFISSLTNQYEFNQPLSEQGILEVENRLHIKMPDELEDLLSESNGVMGEYGLNLIWDAKRIIEDNLRFRNSSNFKELYMPFDSLLFFGDAGNGDQFAYATLNGVISKGSIYAWNHEDDSRIWVAPSLKKFFEWWIKGQIKI